MNARVATLNLGLGVSLAPFLSTDDETERRHVVGNLYESVEASNVSRRMAVLAEELVAVEADVIALQEAALVSAADEGTVDFLDELTAALNDGNSDYRVAAVSETTVVSLPGIIDEEQTTVSLHDRDAILVREGIEATELQGGTFESTLEVSLGDEDDESIQISRGFAAVTVSISDGSAFTLASTHLERASQSVRTEQATELTNWAEARDGPLALAGDMNATPGDEPYEGIAAAFEPVTSDVGPTCCWSGDLTSGELTRTVDHVFVRGLEASEPARFAYSEDVRIETSGGDRWPSDHAGVVVAIEASTSETASPKATSTETTTGRPSPKQSQTSTVTASTSTSAPGFGLLAAMFALAAAAVRARRSD
ncbi:endonuclease/exonuclease/phosphatase family protein [Haloferax mediterranei ATCC 33500]|uniref:Endonuclease/exonuclease/phosphatase family protein n=1 Tax=Haloferax mediterranei (strain ATCC 33500 / DSM 1411 / JCM 8866 / NBRC 14739 / NCIMB 2177 / R-4) TaxID=523841 RepID=I3R218_HALMT|nr:endonuclease/exonuclease/phosphatase family protein [Haloferax mediterranei ATCC 33500]